MLSTKQSIANKFSSDARNHKFKPYIYHKASGRLPEA